MDRMFVGMRTIPLEQGGKYTAAYYILMEEGNMPDGGMCDHYGLQVVLYSTAGERSACVRRITSQPDTIYWLAQRMMRCQVTPAALQDVVEDWLAAV